MIGLLNSYFDCLVPALQAHGGEVLKFVGDGLLGILPVAADPGAACRGALAAAGEARAALAQANAERAARGEPRQRYGLALHLGEVLYGNIGSAGRLDFTTIGPAVNLTARLETLARDLGRELVASAAFARHSPEALHSLGTFRLRGFPSPRRCSPRRTTRPAGPPHEPRPYGWLAANIENAKSLILGHFLGSFGFRAHDFNVGVLAPGNVEAAGQPYHWIGSTLKEHRPIVL